MSKKNERFFNDRFFYAFVDLEQNPSDRPITYIVPSKKVADVLIESQKTDEGCLFLPGHEGRDRSDKEYRRLLPSYTFGGLQNWIGQYENRWELLKTQLRLEP